MESSDGMEVETWLDWVDIDVPVPSTEDAEAWIVCRSIIYLVLHYIWTGELTFQLLVSIEIAHMHSVYPLQSCRNK